jgi:hypothetical protein
MGTETRFYKLCKNPYLLSEGIVVFGSAFGYALRILQI